MLQPPSPLSATDKCIQFTALTWMKTFLSLAQRSMMVFTSNILVSILPSVAYDNDKSRIPSSLTNIPTYDGVIMCHNVSYCVIMCHNVSYVSNVSYCVILCHTMYTVLCLKLTPRL